MVMFDSLLQQSSAKVAITVPKEFVPVTSVADPGFSRQDADSNGRNTTLLFWPIFLKTECL